MSSSETGHFESSDSFVVEDTENGQTRTLKSKKFVISTGSRPVAPTYTRIRVL